MPRCAVVARVLAFPAAALVALAGTLAVLAPLPAAAQVHRGFPQRALRGAIQFGTPPEIVLNGRPTRLSPGARIHGLDNMMQTTGSLIGAKFVVDYTVEAIGLVSEVWLLTPDEIAVTPWPTTSAQSAAWSFDPVAQRWTIP